MEHTLKVSGNMLYVDMENTNEKLGVVGMGSIVTIEGVARKTNGEFKKEVRDTLRFNRVSLKNEFSYKGEGVVRKELIKELKNFLNELVRESDSTETINVVVSIDDIPYKRFKFDLEEKGVYLYDDFHPVLWRFADGGYNNYEHLLDINKVIGEYKKLFATLAGDILDN